MTLGVTSVSQQETRSPGSISGASELFFQNQVKNLMRLWVYSIVQWGILEAGQTAVEIIHFVQTGFQLIC